VKSGGDFEDILADDTPAIWASNRPSKGGETGAMLARIIDRAAKLRAERSAAPSRKKAPSSTGLPRKRRAAAPTAGKRAPSSRRKT